jgi:choloylglycine hydrolase
MCTNFRLKAQDSSVVVGRTMGFPNLMGAKITVLPREFAGAGIAPAGTGKTWTSEHGVVGVDAFGQPGWLTDGMNEKGVYAGRTRPTWTGTC